MNAENMLAFLPVPFDSDICVSRQIQTTVERFSSIKASKTACHLNVDCERLPKRALLSAQDLFPMI